MEYAEWFKKSWYEADGLIQPARAGEMIGLSGARMTQVWKEKNIKLYIYKNHKPMLGWKDFVAFEDKRKVEKS